MRYYPHEHYHDYVTAQLERHHATVGKWQWVQFAELVLLVHHINRLANPLRKRIVCHGVRDGFEVDQLSELLPDWSVVGTEIAQVKHDQILVHDFNHPHPAVCDMSVVYSNSLDHAFDPISTLDVWRDQLATGGLCFLHWSTDHERGNLTASDCWMAGVNEYVGWMQAVGLEHVETIPLEIEDVEETRVLIVGRNHL